MTDWGVIGVGLHSRTMKEALEAQDLRYTVVERDADADEARVVGSLVRYLYAPEDPEAVLAALADERGQTNRYSAWGAPGVGQDLRYPPARAPRHAASAPSP